MAFVVKPKTDIFQSNQPTKPDDWKSLEKKSALTSIKAFGQAAHIHMEAKHVGEVVVNSTLNRDNEVKMPSTAINC